MYTQCPQCRTHFRVRSEHLRAAGGSVRCSLCHHTFNALESLSESLPESARTAETRELRQSDVVRDTDAGDRTGDMFEQLSMDGGEPASPRNGAADTERPGSDDPASELSDLGLLAPRKRPLWQNVAWGLGTAVLVLALGVQLVHAHRDELSNRSTIGPWLERVYTMLEMPRSPRTNLFRFRIHRTEMLAPPDQTGALVLTGVLRNTADFEQQPPHLYLRVEDRWGRRVGHRYVEPASYLAETDRGLAAISSDAEIAFRVTLRDPGPEAVGFTLQPCTRREGRYLCASEFRPPGK